MWGRAQEPTHAAVAIATVFGAGRDDRSENEDDMTEPTHSPRYGQVDRGYGMKLATTAPDDDGPVWMVNLMRYREVADYADGRATALSGREADDAYAPVGPLAAIGAEVVFVGDVEHQFLGDTPKWDRIGVVKYPTRRSFIEMQTRPDFQKLHEHKDAGMAKTIVMGCQPIAHPMSDARTVDWSNVPHPPSETDGPLTMLHVIKFRAEASPDGTSASTATPEAMAQYSADAGKSAVPNGVRIDGWFGVEGTIIGDGRSWDQVRFNTFPSLAAFMVVATDPERLASQKQNREAAIDYTYALGVRASINRLSESIS